MDKDMNYSIERVEGLPNRVRLTKGVYEEVIEDILSREDGAYLIAVGKNKPQTVLQQLYKRIKGREDLKIHQITGKVYIIKSGSARKK
jgi:hypothetical protein